MANIREQIAQDGKAIPLRGGFGKFNNFLPTPSPTVTPSNRPTPTQTPTQTSTQTNTRTPTRTKSRTRPETPTSTPTASVTRTPSPTYTPTATNTPTRTRTQTRTRNGTQTQTPTQTRTQSRTNTQTPTVTRTITPSISPSSTSPFGVAKRSSINVLKNVDWDTVLPPQPTPAPFSPIGNDTYITKQNSYFWDLSTMRVSSNASLNSNFWGASQSDVFNISGISFRPWYPGLEDDGYTSENYSFNTAPGATQFWNLSSGGALSDSIRNALVNVSMITPQHGVCAIHQGLSSMVGTSVYFYRHTDQAPLKRTVSAVYNLNYDSNIQTVDTGVVKLDSALPAGYKVYKVALFDNFLANDFVLTPLPILTMGGMNVPGADTNETKQDIAMGVNNQQIFNPPIPYGIGFREGGFFGPPGDYSGQVYHKQRYNSYGVTLSGYDPSLPDKVFALQFASGDSGNPAFVVYDNELILSTILHTTVQGDAYINPTINQALSDAVDTLGNEGYSINTQNIWKA